MKNILYILGFGLIVVFFIQCEKDNEEELVENHNNQNGNDTTGNPPDTSDCDSINVSFAQDVQPIFNGNCAFAGCHSSGSQAAGYNLADYDGIKSASESGRLIGSIAHYPGFSPMPKARDMLEDCEIGKIRNWINEGTLNN